MENITIIKYLLVLLTAPIWWPVARALWVEVNRMLADDGGVFGRLPDAVERDQVRREKQARGEELVSEPIYSSQERDSNRRALSTGARAASGSGPGHGAQGPARPGAGPPARKTGFR